MERQLLSAPAFVRDGKLFLTHRQAFDGGVSAWRNCRASLTLTEDAGVHSRQLEKFYWGVCIHRISEETGFDENRTHDLMKEQWLPRWLHAFHGGAICWRCARVINGTTTRLRNEEYWTYISDIQRWAVSDLGLILPDPRQELVAA